MMDNQNFFEKLEKHFAEGKAFVAYRKPGSGNKVSAILQENPKVYKTEDLQESGFIFAPFNTEAAVYLIPSEHSETIEFDFHPKPQVDEKGAEFISTEGNFNQREIDQRDHEKLVQQAIDQIKSGDFHKVVVSRSEKVQVHDPSPFRIFKNLLNAYSHAFVYVWFHPETGCWLGATPETLIKTERTKFHTMALAGTKAYQGSEEVEWGHKEVEEQLFVTDYISGLLEEMPEVKNIKLSKAYSKRAGNLLHICTDIEGRLDSNEHLGKLLKSLHPTPAVCGFPKDKALHFILEKEGYNREFYSGFLGELNLKTETRRNSNRRNQENQQFLAISRNSELYVNLRCMKMTSDGYARIFVGGGITRESNAGDEWMETVNKSQTMKAVLVK